MQNDTQKSASPGGNGQDAPSDRSRASGAVGTVNIGDFTGSSSQLIDGERPVDATFDLSRPASPELQRGEPVEGEGQMPGQTTVVTDNPEITPVSRTAGTAPETEVVEEHFIPINRYALLKRLLERQPAAGNTQASLEKFFSYLVTWRHQQYRDHLNLLKQSYIAFSPDRDTLRVLEYSPDERASMCASFVSNISSLLKRANYREITVQDLNRIIAAQSPHRVHVSVDLDEFELLKIYYRGCRTVSTMSRSLRTYFLKRKVEAPIYQRLFLLLKLKDENIRLREIMVMERVDRSKAKKLLNKYRDGLSANMSGDRIQLKLFKAIPQADIAMMFPNIKVRFKRFDQIKLSVTAGGGTVAGVVGTASKLVAAANPYTLAMAVAGFGATIFQQIMSFFNLRNKYMLKLAKRLYFHSLADNRGVLTLLTDRAAEEDVKEEMLLYFFLVQRPVRETQLNDLKAQIEQFVLDEFGARMNFDLKDALFRLLEDGVATENAPGQIEAVSPDFACRRLRHCWINYLDENVEPEAEESDPGEEA